MPAGLEGLWRAWSLPAPLLVGLALAAWLYSCGVRALWRRAGPGHGLGWGQAAAFAGGLASLLVALASPLGALYAALFSAHMAQQLLLIGLAAPLLVLGAPQIAFLWALPQPWRRAFGRWWHRAGALRGGWHTLNTPLVACVLHAAVLSAWHLPWLYQAALHSEAIHGLESALLLSTAGLFWWTIVYPSGRRNYAASLLAVGTLALESSVFGALIAFAPRLWHPDQAAAWGLTPLQDQQLAGMMLWVPLGLLYILAGAALCLAWLATNQEADSSRRRSSRGRSPDEPALRRLKSGQA